MTKKISVESHQNKSNHKKIALVLAGCGAKDGSEITEAVAALVSLVQAGYEVAMYAPDRPVAHVVNHKTMDEEGGATRNILTEAARIARGKIKPLTELQNQKYDALCFPGGFGAAKNLCNFAFAGVEAQLQSDVKKVLKEFIEAQKPIAALCIAPILLALAARDFSLSNATITLGGKNDASKAIGAWNVHHLECANNEACVDEKNLFITSPAYMHDEASPYDIWLSAQAMVKGLTGLFEKISK